MNNKKSMNDHPKQPASWSAILRNLPFTVRVFGLTILIGLSLVSYNIGKAVAEATAYMKACHGLPLRQKASTKMKTGVCATKILGQKASAAPQLKTSSTSHLVTIPSMGRS